MRKSIALKIILISGFKVLLAAVIGAFTGYLTLMASMKLEIIDGRTERDFLYVVYALGFLTAFAVSLCLLSKGKVQP